MQHLFTDQVIIRPLEGFENDVSQLFRSAFLLGCPLDWTPRGIAHYEEMSLGWFFRNPGSSLVACMNGRVVGYALVGVDPGGLSKWVNRKALLHAIRIIGAMLVGRLDKKSRRFYWCRLRDSVEITRSRHLTDVDKCPQVHMNIDSVNRNGVVALALLTAVDQICRNFGYSEWVGEINTKTGRRNRPIERFVGEIVRCVPNHTFSWLTNNEVQRLTVRRRLDLIPESSQRLVGPGV